jgi:hypothetical protein
MPLSNEKGCLFSRKNPLGVGTCRLPPKGFQEVGYTNYGRYFRKKDIFNCYYMKIENPSKKQKNPPPNRRGT